ncbi:hypothetical protein LJC22_04865 [Desulfosarcina sp. OttesenSCG-928-G10]|nr:hypothetical protein [Desulfosarcina sp. OttesenSCG-928-G10]
MSSALTPIRPLLTSILDQLRQRQVSVEFDVVSNPEFLKEGDAVNDFMKPDRAIVGTDNARTAKLLETLYAPFTRSRDNMIIMGVRSAEMTKYAANCMLVTKISFMNEMAGICETVGADISDVRMGIGSDKRIGYHFIYPGVGDGGPVFQRMSGSPSIRQRNMGVCQPWWSRLMEQMPWRLSRTGISFAIRALAVSKKC